MAQLSVAMLAVAFLFGGFPQSGAVRDRLARAGFVSSGRGDSAPPSTTTTLPPPPPSPTSIDAQLATAGYPNVATTIDDRVVTLEGSVPDEASRGVILRLVRSTPGVDSIVDNLVIADSNAVAPDVTSPPTGDSTVGAEADDIAADALGTVAIEATTSRVALSGSVPDRATAEAVLGAVQSVYGGEQIEGAVSVDAEVSRPVAISITLATTRPEVAARLEAEFAALDETQVQVDLDYQALEPSPLEMAIAAVLEGSPIEFASGASAIDPGSEATLDAVAEVLTQFPDARVEVGGHTDDIGTDRGNQALSAERAAAVVAALRARGVENELVAVGYGETRPLVDPATTEAARASNRRTEFLVLES